MEDLKNALKLRIKYNRMDTDKFIGLVKSYVYDDLIEDEKRKFRKLEESFKFMGLNNVDFFTMWFDVYK